MPQKLPVKISSRFSYQIEWSAEDECHIAHCLELPSVKAHGRTAKSALSEIEKVTAFAVQDLLKEKETPPVPFGLRPFKGNLTLRVPAEVHRRLAIRSAEEGVSINQFILSKIV